MKLTKFAMIGTVIYLTLFLIDYLTALYSIGESGMYHSLLGLRIDLRMNEEELFTTFSLTPKVLFTYILWMVLVWLVFMIVKKRNHRRPIYK
ncbi:hypothetical protein LF817_09480 [Halobacillus sp. A1]|uniref:hypothetical protein n=1 Tax=Halobacillus sp. A1 TaxID=2880262 RepID=UPI0020A65F8E|nr:hypothetical protein [Halobacillus sp. A1]MCP3031580.1 hypothetical protein [Halobacillus sp. A1]